MVAKSTPNAHWGWPFVGWPPLDHLVVDDWPLTTIKPFYLFIIILVFLKKKNHVAIFDNFNSIPIRIYFLSPYQRTKINISFHTPFQIIIILSQYNMRNSHINSAL